MIKSTKPLGAGPSSLTSLKISVLSLCDLILISFRPGREILSPPPVYFYIPVSTRLFSNHPYIEGMSNSVRSVEVINPPTTTVARGF